MRIRCACSAAALVVLILPSAFPQTLAGSIFGSVRDATGLAVAGAGITAVSVATAAERRVTTNELGDFVVMNLDPGEYRLTVVRTGFKTLDRRGITLTASERLSVGNLVLEVGAVQEQITVTAQGASVQTVSAERSASITSSQVDKLLIRGRSVTSLLTLLPGVVDPNVNEGEVPDGAGAGRFNVLGNRQASNNLTLDGVTFLQSGGAPNAFFGVGMDTIAEVKILISNYQAEYGRLSGANIHMVSKSGSRDFHGMASYFKRNEALNANNFFSNRLGRAKSLYRYDAWTYNIGGPVYIPGKFNRDREKLFFFWNQEFWPQKTTNALQNSTVPTELERAGNFSQSVEVNGALIPVVDPLSRQPFAGNVVPASRLDPNGQALLKVFPQPNFLDRSLSKGAYNYVTQWSTDNPFRLNTLKLNYHPGSADAFAGTLAGWRQTGVAPNASVSGAGVTAPFVLGYADIDLGGTMLSVQHQHIFSPTSINEARVGWVRSTRNYEVTPESIKNLRRDTWGFNAGALNPDNNPLNLLPAMSFSGITGAASLSYDGRFPLHNVREVFSLSDSFSKTLGEHTLKAGLFAERIVQGEGPNAANFTGFFNFGRNVNNPLDSGHPFANAALGVFNSYQEAVSRPDPRSISWGVDWFVQDNWRVTRRLTLDLGIRFSWFQPFWQPGNRLAGFVPSRYDPARAVKLIQPVLDGGKRAGIHPVTGEIYPASLIGFVAPGSGNPANGMVVTADDPSYPRALIENPGMQAAPRVGFAYDPFGDGKTAIRAGFGLFYDRFLSHNASDGATAYPIVQTPQVQFGTIATFRSAQGFISAPSVTAWERNAHPPRVMTMSFSVQRNIGFGTVVDAGYVGSLGRHLSWERNLQDMPMGTRFDPKNADPTNPRVPLADVFLRPIQGYNGIAADEWAATSNYHSLQVSANRRFARSVEFGASWTWSKAMDYADNHFGGVTTLVPVRVWNYGLAGFDRTHVMKINWAWDLPRRSWEFVPLRAVLNGWQLSGITTFSSGAPVAVGFSQVTSVDLTGTSSIGSRIVITGNPVLPKSERTFSRNFDTSVFQAPPVGSLGNAARSNLRGPGVNNWDIALAKSFPIWERVRLQFRSEFYNAFNHTQFSAYDSTARFDAAGRQVNGQFGQFTAARNPRFIQLALRVVF